MKIQEVTIHNFRGIEEQTIKLNSYSIFVGTNNAGKSTFIDAIRAFYEKDYKFTEKDLSVSLKNEKEAWIEIIFSLSDEDCNGLKKEYLFQDKKLKVRKFFATNDPNYKNGTIYAYLAETNQLSKSSFYGWKGVQQGKFGNIIYIPAVSKVEDHTKMTGTSALRDLLLHLMTTVAKNSSAYDNFKDSVEVFAKEIKGLKSDQNNALYNFEQAFTEKLRTWNTSFGLTINPPTIELIVKNMVGFELNDLSLGVQQDVSGFGSGFQRHFIYSLLELSSRFEAKQTNIVAKESFLPEMTLILFEEPEAFLHPVQQENMVKSLIKMTDTPNVQVICTSHSPFMLSRKEQAIFSLIKASRDTGRVIYRQVSREKWDAIAKSNLSATQKLSPSNHVELRTAEMELMRYFILFNPDRLNIFFADQVLFVEGPSEIVLINKLIEDDKLNIPAGCYILDSMGKFNMPKFMNLCKALGITHSVLYDQDAGSNNQQQWNQLIESSKNEFTRKTYALTNDLESFLDLPKVGGNDKHLKPQLLLEKYINNNISSEKINDFCKIVEDLVE